MPCCSPQCRSSLRGRSVRHTGGRNSWERGLEIRAGLHTGEVETIGEKVGGIAVHIGARVAARAGADEVLVSPTVKELVAGSGLAFEDQGEQTLRAVTNPVRIYRVAN
jgi:class 3 adenylate cyclase